MAGYTGGMRYAQSMGFLRFTDVRKRELFSPAAISGLSDTDSMAKVLVHYQADNADDPIDKMLYTDLMTRVPDHNLVMSDRMAMANSLEVRSPFMDHTLVEFAARLPADMKVRRGRLKHILREVARRHLPDALVNRPKQGFGFPLGVWMQTALRDQLEALARESRLVQAGVFDAPAVERLVREHLSGKVDHNYRLWMLLNLEVWHRVHIDGASGCAFGDAGARTQVPAGRDGCQAADVA
jgi:asparagine synthase (glutamine-hydrolysing)